jgi:hypothetical protein
MSVKAGLKYSPPLLKGDSKMKKILVMGVVMFFLFTISCFAGSDAVYERSRPQEIKGWHVSGYDDNIGLTIRLITELDSTYKQLAGDDKVEAVSSSHADNSQIVTVAGIDNSGKKVSNRLSLAGTSAATSTSTFRYIDQVEMDTTSLGTITIRQATGDNFIISIPIGSIEATAVQHFNGEKDSYVTNWNASVTSTGPGIIFDLRYYPNDNSARCAATGYKVIDQLVVPNISTSSSSITQPIKCPAGGWIAVYATGKATSMDGTATVQGYDIEPQ